MVGKAGDRIIIESEKVGHAARAGEILEVVETPFGVDYRVRWDDGHESSFRPHAGSARIEPSSERAAAPPPRAS
ncbi:MAG: hypothetical protein H6Q36_545 [Chloroflexi bacterium]|jgi:hypothetical protein|nr:hypothetical protein [Chloroflexota bacterium]